METNISSRCHRASGRGRVFLSSSGIGLSKLHRPAPDALIGNIYATLSEHIFNIAKAQGKPEIQPDGVLDD
jgi:hypothetical protein